MYRIKLRPGNGEHRTLDGTVIPAGKPFDSKTPLHLRWPRRFVLVDDPTVGKMEGSPFGEDVTAEFEQAKEVEYLRVFKKGRRYRVTIKGKVQQTSPTRLTSASEVSDVIIGMIAAARGEEELDDSELEDDDEVDNPKGESEDADDDDDDGIVGKKKKKKKTDEE
jgi:hypothetical protein